MGNGGRRRRAVKAPRSLTVCFGDLTFSIFKVPVYRQLTATAALRARGVAVLARLHIVPGLEVPEGEPPGKRVAATGRVDDLLDRNSLDQMLSHAAGVVLEIDGATMLIERDVDGLDPAVQAMPGEFRQFIHGELVDFVQRARLVFAGEPTATCFLEIHLEEIDVGQPQLP